MDSRAVSRHDPATEFDWKGSVILDKLREGCTLREAAAVVGITKLAVLKRRNASPEFADAVTNGA